MNTIKLDIELRRELNDQMQEGYKLFMSGDSAVGSRIWIGLWKRIKEIMITHNLEYVEDLDNSFDGMQSIFNWASDFEMELGNAVRKDKNFAQSRIDFCNEFIARYKDKNDLNIFNMKRAIAETYFELGRRDEGEQLFEKYLEEYPTWGWGWIGWSDQYWLFAQESNKNSDKAIQILEQALEVEELEDRYDVLDRLSEIYSKLEMHQQAGAIRQKIIDYVREKNTQRPKVSLLPIRKAVPVTSSKIGRNGPCTCGSGQKYKKCCGR